LITIGSDLLSISEASTLTKPAVSCRSALASASTIRGMADGPSLLSFSSDLFGSAAPLSPAALMSAIRRSARRLVRKLMDSGRRLADCASLSG